MNDLTQIKATQDANKLFPKSGFAWFAPMPYGRWEFLELLVKKQEDGTKMTMEDLQTIYKEKVCRGEITEKKIKHNFRPWLLRTIGALALDGYLVVSTRLNKAIMDELKRIQEEDKLIAK